MFLIIIVLIFSLIAGDDKGALHLRRKVLYKVDVHRAVELGLDKDSWNQTSSSPAELVQDDVTLPRKENQTKIVKVVLAEGIMGDRIVPLNRKQRQLEIPGAVKNDHKETVPYHDSVYDYAQEKEDMPSAVFDQDIIALSQVEDIESRGKASYMSAYCIGCNVAYVVNVVVALIAKVLIL